jgi:hypothetical protein
VAPLARFSPPGNLPEPTEQDRDAWSQKVVDLIAPFVEELPAFYDPTAEDTPPDATRAQIVWSAFPAQILQNGVPEPDRWKLADSARNKQDEYCEWSVERNDAEKITRVTFTSEVPEYWEHMAARDPERVVALYKEFVDPAVTEAELFDGGTYKPDNDRNTSTTGRLAHLVKGDNNLFAAVDLAARATVLRQRAGKPVVTKQDLVVCAGLGNQFRNSDPQIAIGINDAVARGARVAFADPVGLYIKGLITGGFETPDGADPGQFWTIERGTEDHTLRASYSVPESFGYTVGDIKIRGQKIRFGAQLADNVCVRITALAKDGGDPPKREPCKA